jgi:hypothetical protein
MVSPLAGDLNAIPPEQRASHQALIERLMSGLALETRELIDGYAFRFMASDNLEVAAYVANESFCCPFLAFEIEVGAERGLAWLRITGREGVKEFLRSEMQTNF